MKKITILPLIVLLLLSGCSNKSQSSSKPKTVQNKNYVEATGIIKSNSHDIAFDTNIKILKINVKEGQKVKKGDVLFTVDFSEINNAIAEKQHEIQEENSNLNILKRQRQIIMNNSGNGDLTQNGNKDDQLYIKDNEIEVENEKTKALTEAKDALSEKLSKAYIKGSDIVCDTDSAVITNINVKEGDIASAPERICTIMDIGSIYVEAKVDEQFIKDVAVGKKTDIFPSFDSTKKYTGSVISIANAAITENGTTSVTVIISIDKVDAFINPNYNVDVQLSKN